MGATEHHPLLCEPAEKAAIEAANGVEQIEYVSEVVRSAAIELREQHVLDLHRLAVQNIYPCAGNFRRVAVSVGTHNPPLWPLVTSMTHDAICWINENRTTRSALERAAFALWKFNWIHPFAGGNGRTSRAIAYLILCLDGRAMLPGTPSMPSRIYNRRQEYVVALRAADATAGESEPDFSKMMALLKDILMQQMAEVIDGLASGNRSSSPR